MGNSRLGLSFVAVLLIAGMGTACKKGQASTGLDPATGPPGWGHGVDPKKPFQPLLKRPAIEVVSNDAKRRTSALALLDSKEIGLLHESAPEKLEQDKTLASETLKHTIEDLPASLAKTFGPGVARSVSQDFGFEDFDPKDTDHAHPKTRCVHSACLIDVYFRNWEAFDGLNQLFELDPRLPWNNYPGTRYRSARATPQGHSQWKYVVTWALVFPLNDAPAGPAGPSREPPKVKGRKR